MSEYRASSSTPNKKLPQGGSVLGSPLPSHLTDRDGGKVVMNIRSCARCGLDHDGLKFEPLVNAPEWFTHFGTCPQVSQPILMKLERDLLTGS